MRVHKDQNTILDRLVYQGYLVIDAHYKVKHLKRGIKIKGLGIPNSQIMASDMPHSDFDSSGHYIGIY